MLLLGIETSCDETAAAVVRDGVEVQSSVIASSRKLFERLGGVIPEEAARKQLESMLPMIQTALADANLSLSDLDAIAVTKGPGLIGSLLVGTSTARLLGAMWDLPVIGVHHTLGHLSSTWISPKGKELVTPEFPVITLSVSGGHTDLWHRTTHTTGELIGRTRDDAAGEAFDKGAALLGLPYPGGPAVGKAAEQGECVHRFPHPLQGERGYDYSFSGLKTALRYLLRDLGYSENKFPTGRELFDIAASYEDAICHHLLSRLQRVVDALSPKEVHIVGGVSANARLRKKAAEMFQGLTVRFPVEMQYCTDNAAMIASAGYFALQEQGETELQNFETTATLDLRSAVRVR